MDTVLKIFLIFENPVTVIDPEFISFTDIHIKNTTLLRINSIWGWLYAIELRKAGSCASFWRSEEKTSTI
jgi:hypothetical protein